MCIKKLILRFSYACLTTLTCLGLHGQENNKQFSTSYLDIANDLFDAEALMQRVKFLSLDSLEGRKTGERGNLIARNYIIEQFKKHNVEPFSNNYLQPFSFENRRDSKNYQAANVLGLIKGSKYPEKYIVLSAHYDHVGIINGTIYNGADDDASGVSALFALIEYLNKNPLKYSVIIAAFDAEELGLKGAQHFLKSFPQAKENILLNINLDMIGRNDDNQMFVVGANLHEELKPLINDLKLPENFYLLSGHDGTDKKQNWTYSSDHGIFHKSNIPFLYFGVEDHEDYHQPTDDYENIQKEFYTKAIMTIISVIERINYHLF
jgi:Zn-dependent M28 family amino/carboxypeptidase